MGSDTSSDQETSRSVSPDHSRDGLGRSYECTFCKRGFTNAQALGGHMNIHRKDKAKAKAKDKQQNNLTTTSNSFKLISNQEAHYLDTRIGDHGSYQFAPSNPNFPWSLAGAQFDNHRTHEKEHFRDNLNLGIGTSEMGNNNIGSTMVGQEDWFENEVDLELRLGHYP
ncbi:uncharacterized protein [Rutidosis leptorrhynchoides]|uniref:uncharacterized protein n=1 Tax=Rutidosis leptorrhynchoides TaxID=125765 RepID=UPI003A9A54F4